MNVAQLIQELQALDPETEVFRRTEMYGGLTVKYLDDLCRYDSCHRNGRMIRAIEFGELA
jgi:hypothetical protein